MDDRGKWNGALLGLFVGSGCAALIYEIVWLHQLGLVLGASAVSLAILLTSFMGGMCLGSLAYAWFVSARRHPLLVYAALEMLIALFAVAILWWLPTVGRMYWSIGEPGSGDLPIRAIVALMVLLPPTICMGATLPAVSRWVEVSRQELSRTGLARLGLFYGANTFGAMLGTLLAGLYLLRVYDVSVATYVAASINAGVALIAVLVARSAPFEAPSPLPAGESEPDSQAHPCRTAIVYVAIGLSGLTALGAEVVWTRQLGLLFGPTTYTFSIILAIFLLGLGIGSSAGAAIARRVRSPGLALAVVQLLLMAAIPVSACMIVGVLPHWHAGRDATQSMWARTALDLVRGLTALLPATCLWGASFPLAVAAAAGGKKDLGSLVGKVYAANTLGAIVGALMVSLVALPRGGQFAQQVLTFLAGCSGLLMLGSVVAERWLSETKPDASGTGFRSPLAAAGMLLAIAAFCPFAPRLIPAVPPQLLACGRALDRWDAMVKFLYVGEGLNSTVVIAESKEGFRCFHVAGRVEATTSPSDMRTQRLLGHLPALVHPHPKKVLVVGCGSGMTAGSFLLHPSVEQIVLCEIEARVPEATRGKFDAQNYEVLDDPRTRIVIDDARHFLATTTDRFDIITTDPIHPWVRGSASLYTAEFYELCKNRLSPGGVVAQWVPLYESNEAAVKCEMATFLEAFPHATVWSGESRTFGYDVVALGSVEGRLLDVKSMSQRVSYNRRLYWSLAEVGLVNLDVLMKSLAADGPGLARWLKGAEINRDCNLRLQYLAGMTPENQTAQEIFESMTQNVPRNDSDTGGRQRGLAN